mgnify:CR=1 FL=1|jgi:hypothetical protein|tara:strand:+ start:464 stop:673 length:210 start_codon:yes stop_codon:yes gene_type:complete
MSYIPLALKYTKRFVGYLSSKSDENPKKSNAFGTVALAALGYWGIDAEDVSQVGDVVHQLGSLLGGTCG